MENVKYYGIGYKEYLRRKRKAAKIKKDSIPKPPSLHEQIETWYNDLSDDHKSRAWTMREFKAIFGESAQRTGAVLFELGWTRKRMWRDDRPTARYWLKMKE